MNDLVGLLQRLDKDLRGHPSALVGGLAVSVRTEPRFTQDVDLAIAVDGDDEAEALVASLASRGWKVTSTLDQDAARRLAAVRVLPPGDDPRGADLLFAASGIEAEIVERAEELEVLPGLRTRVATTGHLIALKALSSDEGRPQDEADLRALLDAVEPAEIELARESARLIMDRGYHRGRDLVAEIDRRIAG